MRRRKKTNRRCQTSHHKCQFLLEFAMTVLSTKKVFCLVLCALYCHRVAHSALVVPNEGAVRGGHFVRTRYRLSYLSDNHLPRTMLQRSTKKKAYPCKFHASTTAAAAVLEESGNSKNRFQFLTDFAVGFQHINSNYLEIFWTYSFTKTMSYLLPIYFLLVACRFLSPDLGFFLSQSLDQMIGSIFWISSWVGRILLLPLAAFVAVVKALPAIIVPILEYMPPWVVVNFVSPILYIHKTMNSLRSSWFLSTLAVAVWRPILEEFQYRFLVTKIIGEESLGQSYGLAKSSMVEPLVVLETTNSTTNNTATTTTSNPLSRSFLLSSFLLAATRLGWLCTSPDNVSPSPYAWTVGFCQSALAHLSSNAMSELRPMLQSGLTFLALHQSITTFLVSINIYDPIYKERGIFASMGAHIAWTTGIITIPFRMAKRLFSGSSLPKLRSVSTNTTFEEHSGAIE
jgi:hypothetical protein